MRFFKRLIERPPLLFRLLFPEAVFRLMHKEATVYITFDDGPIPEVTPWVLDQLDRFNVKATFFMVGENVKRYPDLFYDVCQRGHAVGNHTMHHLKGFMTGCQRYVEDVNEADKLIDSPLFRPPHGILRWGQAARLKKRFMIVMYDLVTRDYSQHLTAEDVIRNVKQYTRPGSIIVFHDSLKSFPRLKEALPESLRWLKNQGYRFAIPDFSINKGKSTVANR